MTDPKFILEKFLAVLLMYAGFSLIYFSVTGKYFLSSGSDSNVYIFIMGFIAILWAIPNLLSEFWFFKNFLKSREKLEKERQA